MISAAIYMLISQSSPPAGFKLEDAVPYAVVMAIVGVGAYWGRALVDRRKVSAVAEREEATAADVVSKAAAALVDPLRKELETVRAELDRVKDQMHGMGDRMHELTVELGTARRENTGLQQENARLRLELQANGNGEKK